MLKPLQPNTLTQIAPTVALAAVLIIAILVFAPESIPFGSPGNLDFIQYWTGHKILLAGGNPYDPLQLLQAQKALGYLESKPLMYWSPAWGLWLLSPILNLPNEVAAAIWLKCNLALHVFCAFMASFLAKDGSGRLATRQLAAFGLCLIFPPIINLATLGQSSMIMATGWTVALLCLVRSDSSADRLMSWQTWVTGAGLALTTLKPHIFFLIYTLFAIRAVYRREFALPVAGACCVLFFFLMTEIAYPGSTEMWLGTLGFGEVNTITHTRQEFATATLGTIITLALSTNGVGPLLPKFLVPAALFVGTCIFAVRTKAEWFSIQRLCAVLAISAFTAPYGWFYDQVVLITLGTIAIRSQLSWKVALIVYIGLCLAGGNFVLQHAHYQHELWWFLAGTAAFSSLAARRIAIGQSAA